MESDNFERMLALAEEAFDVRHDPEQLDVDETVIERLKAIHPNAVSEYADEKGPAVWILLIPTTQELMEAFLAKKISEKELFESTSPGEAYKALYLCSAMVLEEYRHKGLAKQMTLKAIAAIRHTHKIDTLFVWAFSEAGKGLAQSIAKACELSLRFR
jgi:ribosomal protein S18 acetylase RimI-like enzyme